MGIRIKRKVVAFESVCMAAIDPEYHRPNESWIKRYLDKHPFPYDDSYTEQDIIYDLIESTGMLTFPNEIKDETIEYLTEMLNELI